MIKKNIKMANNFFPAIKSSLNKISTNDLWLMFVLALLLNIDRLALGEYGLLRRLDVSDGYVSTIIYFANFWTNPSEFGWNSLVMRGWAAEIGSLVPQYLGSLIAIFLKKYYVFPVLHIIAEFIALYGAFIFLKSFLGYKRNTALFGSFIFLSIHYWYSEGPFVTSAEFMPLLVAVVSIGKEKINVAIRFFSMVLITTLSVTPYVLPIMPMVHILVILIYSNKNKLKINLVFTCFFWFIFSIYHFNTIWGLLNNFDFSNRAIWEGSGQSYSFMDTLASLINQTVLFPAVMVFALTTRKTIRPVLYAVGIITTILVLVSFHRSEFYYYLINYFPKIKEYSFFYTRFHNFIGFVIFMAVSLLFEKEIVSSERNRKKLLFLGLGLLVAIELIIFAQHGIKITLVHLVCSLVIIGVLLFYRQSYFQNTILTLTVLFVVLTPFRLSYSLKRENPYQGNLFIDTFTYETKMKAFRIATVMNEPWQDDYFSTQISIKGLESFEGGGNSFYNKKDALLWRDNVADGAPSWKNLGFDFNHWNNRVELIKEDFDANSDRIFQLMKLNNVLFVRSLEPIEYPEFNLIDKKIINLITKKSLLLINKPEVQRHYLYKLKEPKSRVFLVPSEIIDYYDKTLANGRGKWNDLEWINQSSTNIILDEYKSGLISFNGSFTNYQKILTSTNYSDRWQLFINNKLKQENLSQGPMGMLQIEPVNEKANYQLRFKSNFISIILYMFIAFVFFLCLSIYIGFPEKQNSLKNMKD
jgi:hypothetical protein